MLSQVGVNPQEPAQDGFLTMSEVLGLELAAELVALTACNTGVGKHLTGEGVMGLGRAFQYAGAQSVLMSLWSVEDESTNLLTERVFAALQQGASPLAALQQARAALRQAGYAHPFFWAPFILVGAESPGAHPPILPRPPLSTQPSREETPPVEKTPAVEERPAVKPPRRLWRPRPYPIRCRWPPFARKPGPNAWCSSSRPKGISRMWYVRTPGIWCGWGSFPVRRQLRSRPGSWRPRSG